MKYSASASHFLARWAWRTFFGKNQWTGELQNVRSKLEAQIASIRISGLNLQAKWNGRGFNLREEIYADIFTPKADLPVRLASNFEFWVAHEEGHTVRERQVELRPRIDCVVMKRRALTYILNTHWLTILRTTTASFLDAAGDFTSSWFGTPPETVFLNYCGWPTPHTDHHYVGRWMSICVLSFSWARRSQTSKCSLKLVWRSRHPNSSLPIRRSV